LTAVVDFGQREVGGTVANLKGAGAGVCPEGFERECEEGNWSGDRRHEAAELLRRFAHLGVDDAAANDPQQRDEAHAGEREPVP
jgi:hypothetical protein